MERDDGMIMMVGWQTQLKSNNKFNTAMCVPGPWLG